MCIRQAGPLILSLLFLLLIPKSGFSQIPDLKFEHITSQSGLPQNTIHGIAKDKFGFMWFGTWGGLCRYDGYTFKIYKNDPKNVRSLNNNRVHNIIRDKYGDIWVLTFKANELCKYNYLTDDFDRIDERSVSPHFRDLLERRKHFESVNFSYKNYRWTLDRYVQGLFQRNLTTGDTIIYGLNRANPWSLNDPYVTDIYKDNQNIFWVGTYSNGLNKANLEAKPFKYFYHDPADKNSIVDNNVRAISEDQEGNLWIGTRDKGITILKTGRPSAQFRNEFWNPGSLGSDQVKKIYCDSRGTMWIGHKKGLDSYNPSDDRFQHWIEQGMANTTVFGITEDRYNNLWFASWKGIYQYIPAKKKMIHHDAARTLKSGHARTVIVDRRGILWVGTEGGGLSVLKYSAANESLKAVRHFVHSDKDASTLSDDRVNALFEDKRGFIWIGTGDGLDRLDPRTMKITHLSGSTGLAHATIAAMVEDNQGNLWVSHKEGISRLNTKNFQVRNYTIEDGLQSNEFSDEACHKSTFSNLLFFGGNNGFNSFNPDSIKADKSLPETVITQLQVLNHNVGINEEVNGRVILTRPLYLTKDLLLTYDDKSFSLEFAGLHYANPNGNKYAYKLEGFDNDWIYTNANRRIATYANLDPGTYKFLVRSSNSDGVWNPSPAVLSITVKPPFWASTYAYLIYLFVILGLLYVYHYYSTRYTRLKSKLAYESLIREKENELHQHKLQFFTNISHEIKTPLTLILAPLEKLSDLYFENSFVNDQIRNMKTSGERLLRLINQLLDFRRLETGSTDLKLARHNLIPFVENIIASFRVITDVRGINLSFHSDENEFFLDYDDDKLEKVLANLLSNAVKFTPEGGYIEVRLPSEGVATDFARIEVANSGKGIPADEREAIFRPFVQSRTNTEGGTGLGLSYSKALLELHGGSISVRCKELTHGGYETVFEVQLPVKPVEKYQLDGEVDDEVSPEELNTLDDFAAGVSLEGMDPNRKLSPRVINGKVPQLLIVEDNFDLRKYLMDHFQGIYQVIEASNGREGLEMALANIPDLIISDVMMPEMDGIEFCKRIKTDIKTNHIPVILLTAKTPVENQIEGLETGADDYIVKPFNLGYLTARVKNVLLSRNSLKEKYRKEISITPTDDIPLSADDKLMNKVLKYVEAHISEPELNIEAIAGEVGLSRAQLYRRIKAITGLTVAEVVRELKLKRAKQLLKDRKFNINEITYMIGFSDADYFRKCFKAEFGVAPSKYYKSIDGENNLGGSIDE